MQIAEFHRDECKEEEANDHHDKAVCDEDDHDDGVHDEDEHDEGVHDELGCP